MTTFMKLRDSVRSFFSAHSYWLSTIAKGVMWFICATMINRYLGFSEVLSSPLIALGLSVFLAFPPMSVGGIVFSVAVLLQVFSLSRHAVIAAIGFFLLAYIICGIYRCERTEFFVIQSSMYFLGLPFLAPLFTGLFGKAKNGGSVAFSCIISWFLKTISENAAQLTDSSAPVTMADLLVKEIVSNPMFYVYLSACMAVFVVSRLITRLPVDYAWQIAAGAGVMAGFFIGLTGRLFLDRRSGIVPLIISSLIVAAAGLIVSLFFRDLDYSRTEKVSFEDDEYLYYVTAVPKIHVAEEVNEIKKIKTPEKKGNRR